MIMPAAHVVSLALIFAQYTQAQALPAGVSPGSKSSDLTIKLSNGDTRDYLLHVPRSYTESVRAGLVLVYAGRGSDNEHAESSTHFSDPSYNPDMLVVYPQGTTDPTGEPVWQGDPNAKADDVAFTLELLDKIVASYAIDENRIYASGMSNGGGFVANHLACDEDASKIFAAFGAVSAAYYQFRDASRRSCKPNSVKIDCNNGGNKVPIIDIHGGKDQTIEYSGGYRRGACLPSIPHFLTSWAERNGMESSNHTSELHSGKAMHYTFGAGDAAGMVQSYFVPTMGHVWPSGFHEEVLNATDVLMDFFLEWSIEKRDKAATTLPNSSAGSHMFVSTWFMAYVSVAALAVVEFI
jgi:poly(3-hydroxybutyrate) depolymerase